MARHYLTRHDTWALARQFDFYHRLLDLEMAHQSGPECYELSFSRLLKPDPIRSLGLSRPDEVRPTMVGADERDLFLPPLRREFERLDAGARIFDIGCGDGQTVGFVADALPRNRRRGNFFGASRRTLGLSFGCINKHRHSIRIDLSPPVVELHLD